MRLGKLFASIAALAALVGLAAGGYYYFGNSKPQAEGIYIKSADGAYLVLKPDAQGIPKVERSKYREWRFERAPEGRLVMLRDAPEFKQIPEYYRLLQPDPKTGKPLWFRQYVLAPSATVPGDWDIVEIANDPPTDPPIKLKRPLPSLLHRVDDPRVIELADKTAAVRDKEWRPESERCIGIEEYKSASLPPSAPHDDLLGLASAIAQAHPADAHLAMLRMDALIAARDFKTLETEIEKWRSIMEKPSFLRLPFHRAEAALDAWKLSLAGKNAHELMEKMYGAQTDLTTRLRLTPEVLKFDNLALPVTTVWMDIQANYLNMHTATKVNGVLSNFLLLQGRRDEALRLLACNYRVGQFLECDPSLISKLIGLAIRGIIVHDLGAYALNACETPQECSAFWQWLEYLNTNEPTIPDPTNLKQPLGGIRLEEVVNFLPEWRDVGILESKGLDSNLLEVATRANVGASKFQLVRMGAAARAHQFASGRLPASAADLAPLLPAGAPPDPFTSAPLRLATKPAGVTCYSVGPDRADDFGAITYDPSNGSDSRGDIVLEVPGERQYPFPRVRVRARTPQELLAQFPTGLPPDPFADTKGRPLSISNTSPVYIYSFGPDRDEKDTGFTHPQAIYDPTNGTSSRGDLFMQVPWQ